MARTEGRIKCAIWRNPDFRSQTGAAQRAYMLIVSQPGMNYCGVIPYRPKVWAKLASDTSVGALERSIRALEASLFVIVDRDTDELWVRTFVHHDGVLGQPKLILAMAHDFGTIESEPIRQGFLEGLAQGFPEGLAEGLAQRFRKASDQGMFSTWPEPFAEALGLPSRATRAGARSPTPNPQPPRVEPSIADGLLREWYDGRDPRPVLKANSWVGMRSVVQKALDNGHPPETVRTALHEVDVVSAGWLEPALRKAKANNGTNFAPPRTVYR